MRFGSGGTGIQAVLLSVGIAGFARCSGYKHYERYETTVPEYGRAHIARIALINVGIGLAQID